MQNWDMEVAQFCSIPKTDVIKNTLSVILARVRGIQDTTARNMENIS